MARREDYGKREDGSDVELPEGVLVLTCGIDTQDDRLEYGSGRTRPFWRDMGYPQGYYHGPAGR